MPYHTYIYGERFTLARFYYCCRSKHENSYDLWIDGLTHNYWRSIWIDVFIAQGEVPYKLEDIYLYRRPELVYETKA